MLGRGYTKGRGGCGLSCLEEEENAHVHHGSQPSQMNQKYPSKNPVTREEMSLDRKEKAKMNRAIYTA
jgi:hypothetical protein